MNMASIDLEDMEKRIDLFIEYGSDLDEVDMEGKSALHYAIEFNNIPLAQVLLLNYCDPDIQDRYGNAPLHYLQDSDSILVQIFVESFADFSIQNKDGESLEKYLKTKNL
jgi:ankyrin repeat protein